MDAAARPEAFTLSTRPSLAARGRDAWIASDYGRQLDERILAPRLQHCVTIAVVSPKGGVGRTFITALLGSLLAYLRRDRLVAVDANPDFRSLGRRLVPDHPCSSTTCSPTSCETGTRASPRSTRGSDAVATGSWSRPRRRTRAARSG